MTAESRRGSSPFTIKFCVLLSTDGRLKNETITLPFLRLTGGEEVISPNKVYFQGFFLPLKTAMLPKCVSRPNTFRPHRHSLGTTEGSLPLVKKNLCSQDEAKTEQLGPMIYSTCFNGQDVWASQMEVTVVDLAPRLPA